MPPPSGACTCARHSTAHPDPKLRSAYPTEVRKASRVQCKVQGGLHSHIPLFHPLSRCRANMAHRQSGQIPLLCPKMKPRAAQSSGVVCSSRALKVCRARVDIARAQETGATSRLPAPPQTVTRPTSGAQLSGGMAGNLEGGRIRHVVSSPHSGACTCAKPSTAHPHPRRNGGEL